MKKFPLNLYLVTILKSVETQLRAAGITGEKLSSVVPELSDSADSGLQLGKLLLGSHTEALDDFNRLYINKEAAEHICMAEAFRMVTGRTESQVSEVSGVRNVFSLLTAGGEKAEPAWLPGAPLAINRSAFAVKNQPTRDALIPGLADLCKTIATLGGADLSLLPELLIQAIQYHCPGLSMPGSGGKLAWADTVAMQAAAAASIHLWAEESGYHEAATLSEQIRSGKPFLFTGGDLSGIQSYIYGIIPRKAAKNLKGRSFYVQLLAENVKAGLMNALNLPHLHVVYSSGGGFYALLPNTAENRTAVDAYADGLEEGMFSEFGDKLYMALAAIELGVSRLSGASLRESWAMLSARLADKKQRRYARLMQQDFDRFFGQPSESGLDKDRDAITGEEIIGETRTIDDHKVALQTWRQTELGKCLKTADYWVAANSALADSSPEVYRPAETGPYNYFLTEKQFGTLASRLPAGTRVSQLNRLPAVPGQFCYLYGGNDYPANRQGQPKTFEELASDEHAGYRRLGILRMDVDSLGSLFRNGFSDEDLLLPSYSALSYRLDLFFRGYLNTLWLESEKPEAERHGYSDFTQIIYSGGDDLFLVGRWDLLPELASEIRTAFAAYTGHPGMGISGGITLVTPRYPLLRAAGMAADAEDDAKKHRHGDRSKDSLSFLGYPLGWQKEYEVVRTLKEELVNRIATNGLNKGFIQRIAALHESAGFDAEAGNRIKNLEVIWRLAYYIKRQLQGREQQELRNLLNNWSTAVATGKLRELPDTGYHALQLLNVAGRWAELELRN